MQNQIQEVPLFGTTPLSPVEAEVLRLRRFGLEDSDIFVEVCLLHGGIALIQEIAEVAQAKAQEFTYEEDTNAVKAIAKSLSLKDDPFMDGEDWVRLQYKLDRLEMKEAQQ